jgi:tetratricopeptide (TPR) repeat protein
MRSTRKPLLACLLGIALAVPALAQQSGGVTQYPACPDPPPKLSPAEVDAAHASFKVGVEAYNKGAYDKALDNFRDAFRRDCSRVALLNFISRAYEGKGDKAEAIHALEVYLQRNPKAEDADDIQTRITNLKAQLAPTTNTTTATTSAPTTTVTVVPTVTATATATATEESRGHTAGPWIVLGVGVAAAIAGGVMLGVGQGEVAHSRDGCASNGGNSYTCTPLLTTPKDNQNRATLNTDGTTLTNVGFVVAGVGVAAMVGGLIWHFIEPTGPKKVSLMPTFAPGYAGMSLGASF